MATSTVVGWDIGGAHVKAARVDEVGKVTNVLQVPCALWQGMVQLERAIAEIHRDLGEAKLHAITMTGEMVDLFSNRAEGVTEITDALAKELGAQPCVFFAGQGRFVTRFELPQHVMDVASANWRASAEYLAHALPDGLLVDVGSTTTDVVPISRNVVFSRGWNDGDRLTFEELLYTGVVRTPLMSLASRWPFAGEWVPVMAEHFATTSDVYHLTGELRDDLDQHEAADGGEKDEVDCARRLARMIGRDCESTSLDAWRRLAHWLADTQLDSIRRAAARCFSRGLLSKEAPIVGAGVGRFVARKLATASERPYRDFSELVAIDGADPEWVANCAPAVAVALLAPRTWA